MKFSPWARFSSTGATALAGTFAMLANGFGLTSGDAYTVMSFPSHIASFGTITGTNLGLSANLTATTLTLTVGTQADLSPITVNFVTPAAQSGQPVTGTYTVKNLGGAPAIILSPPTVRVGSPILVHVEIHSAGSNSFTPGPLVQVDASNVASGQEHQQLVDPALPQFFRDKLSFALTYEPKPHAAHVVSNFNPSLITGVQAIDWHSQKDHLRPRGVPPDSWNTIWANLRPRLKSTVGDLYALLGQDAAALAAKGVSANRLYPLLRFEIATASGQAQVPVTRSAIDLAFRAPGLPLQSHLQHQHRWARGWEQVCLRDQPRRRQHDFIPVRAAIAEAAYATGNRKEWRYEDV